MAILVMVMMMVSQICKDDPLQCHSGDDDDHDDEHKSVVKCMRLRLSVMRQGSKNAKYAKRPFSIGESPIPFLCLLSTKSSPLSSTTKNHGDHYHHDDLGDDTNLVKGFDSFCYTGQGTDDNQCAQQRSRHCSKNPMQ